MTGRLAFQKPVLAATLAAAILAGCAAPVGQGVSSPVGQASNAPTSKIASSGIGAGVGCAIGAVGARLMGGNAAKGCAIGAVSGAAVGYAKARQDEIDEIRLTQQQMPGSFLQTRNVEIVDRASGQSSPAQVLHTLTVPLSPQAIYNPEGRKVFYNLGTIARKQSAIVTVTGGGTQRQQEQAATMIRQGGANNVSIDTRVLTSAGKPGDMVIIVTPIDKSPVISV